MNPPLRAIEAACAASPGPSSKPETSHSAAPTGTALVAVDQFIWPDREAPAAPAASKPEAATADAEVSLTAPEDHMEPTRVVVLEAYDTDTDADAPIDTWRRQLISALHEADREPVGPPPLPVGEPPPFEPVNAITRAASRAQTAPNRPSRLQASAPIARAPRRQLHVRIGLAGAAAAVGILFVSLPNAANTPENTLLSAASAPAPARPSADHPTQAAADAATLKPVMFNAPVLVREGQTPPSDFAAPTLQAPVLPVIETVRTVPVQIVREFQAPQPAAPFIAMAEPPAPAHRPEPVAEPRPLDRDGLATLVATPSGPSPDVAPPPPARPQQQAAIEPPLVAPAPQTTRAPQISSSYQRALPAKTQQAKKRSTRTSKKAATPTHEAQWQSNRQGLRTTTPPPEEPSTMVKLLKALNPFSSEEKTEAQSKAPASTKKDTFWWR